MKHFLHHNNRIIVLLSKTSYTADRTRSIPSALVSDTPATESLCSVTAHVRVSRMMRAWLDWLCASQSGSGCVVTTVLVADWGGDRVSSSPSPPRSCRSTMLADPIVRGYRPSLFVLFGSSYSRSPLDCRLSRKGLNCGEHAVAMLRLCTTCTQTATGQVSSIGSGALMVRLR